MHNIDFGIGVTQQEIETITESFKGSEWDHAKSWINPNRKITSSAIKIAARIKKDFGITLFPLIVTIGRKGYRSSGGPSFRMYGLKEEIKHGELYFSNAAHLYPIKKNKLYKWVNYCGAPEIGIEAM